MNDMPILAKPRDNNNRDLPDGEASGFIFDHIPKTGGSAFRAVLEQIFGTENVSPLISGRSELWAEQAFAQFRVVTGHFHSPIPVDRTHRARARITMLRDPIDRAISEYYYYRNDVERVEWNKLAVLAKDHDFYAYIKLLESQRNVAISNFYTRRFASQVSRKLMGDEEVLALAKEALSRYDFIGIQEQFVDSVDIFCCAFKLPPVPEVHRVNSTSSRAKLNDLDPQTRRTLLHLNRLDIELYEFVLGNFERRKRAIFHSLAGTPELVSAQTAAILAGRRSDGVQIPESFGDRAIEFRSARIVGSVSGSNVVRSGEELNLYFTIDAHIAAELTVGIEISDELGEIVFGTNTYLMQECRAVAPGTNYEVKFSFSANLRHGHYSVGASLHTGATHEERCFDWRDGIATFDVIDEASAVFVGYCRLHPKIQWEPEGATSARDLRMGRAAS